MQTTLKFYADRSICLVGELIINYLGRGNGRLGNRYHFHQDRGIGNRSIFGWSILDRGINTAPALFTNLVACQCC